MLLIHCPHCNEALPELEFTYAGEARLVRPANPAALSDAEWADYLFNRCNARGPHYERWRHSHGCARYFNALRDTVTDRFLATYKVGEAAPDPDAPDPDAPRAEAAS